MGRRKIDFIFTRYRCRAKEGNIRDIELTKTLLKMGYVSGMLTGCQEIHSQLEREGIFSVQLIREIKIPSRLENFEERARRIENDYDIPSLKNFVFSEKCYYGQAEDFLLRKAVVYFEWLERLFDKDIEVKCLVNDQGGQINIRALYAIARKRGIPVIYTGESLFADRMFLYEDEMYNRFGFKNIAWEEITKDQKEELEDYLRQFREEKRVYTHSLMFGKKDELKRSALILAEHIQNRQFEVLRVSLAKKFWKIFAKTLNRIFSRFIYQNALGEEGKFVYFPLHLAEDTQITLRNPQFFDQGSLAVYVARSLPFGYKLYVKEHPDDILSLRDKLSFLREKNIVLLNPKLNSRQIVQIAQAVVIINSTVGFEALHYFKPVVVLGNWHLIKDKGLPEGVVINAEDFSRLDKTLKLALENPPIDQNKIKAFLFSLRKATFPGSVGGIVSRQMDYQTVADSLVKKYQELKKC